mgnify:CR=1 FL=1
MHPLPIAGANLLAFLSQVHQLATPEQRQIALQGLFRWFLLLEGKEEGRLSSEELKIWLGRFYAILPAELKRDFPWEIPDPLPPQVPQPPPYPRYHTPFRQYGFWAARIVDSLPGTIPPEGLAVVLQGLLQILHHHGERVEAKVLARHLEDLSGGRLRVPEQAIALAERAAPSEGSRPAGESSRFTTRSQKGRRFHKKRHR